ncbi:urease accessory protein [Isoptericola jiangsuensis]|uniref:Urease accessory protein n=1 Tax=Isoptericola jiangsuensis TaxID=548579 RepID=A0A2A9EVD9_9MICO|nr:urease accessory protein UreD [Isoptericola jiangsuensis]PFG42250.1 urease accessory protein [Isoptericola jiangsuensis]
MLRPTSAPARTSVHVRAAAAPGAPVRVTTVDGLLAARRVSHGPAVATVALVAQGALLLGGDHVVVTVDVDDGLALALLDVGGTVAYDGDGLGCRWDVHVRLGVGASLDWAGLPLVVATGADVTRTTTVHLAAGSRLHLRETTVLGRSGEHGGHVVVRSVVHDDDGPLLVEELAADGARPVPGVLGTHRVLDTVADLHGTPTDEEPAPPRSTLHDPDVATLHLERGGTLVRWLGTATHVSPLDRPAPDPATRHPEEA